MSSSMQAIYESHHQNNRQQGFSIMKSDRGEFFARVIGKGKRVLDIGCRDGALTSFFVAGNKVLGADIDSNALARAKKDYGIDTMMLDLLGDWREIAGRKFDVVVAGEVLEHLYYPQRVSQKAHSVLAHGGLFIGSVPNAFSLKNRLRYLMGTKRHTPLSDPTHINHFSKSDLEKMLSGVFSEVKVSGLGKYKMLAKLLPSWCAFDLVFIAKK